MKKSFHALAALLMVVAFIAAGCQGDNNDPAAGQNSVVVNKASFTGNQNGCTNGGISIEAGIDRNSNGILDASEVTSTQYVCNGTDGQDGADGAKGGDGKDGINGVDADSVTVELSDAGSACPNGGTKVSVLVAGAEVSSDYICNGADLAATANPESCAVCHEDIAATHKAALVTGDVVVSNVVSAPVGSNLEITFNVKVEGVNSDAYTTLDRAYVHYEGLAQTLTATERSNNVRVTIATAPSGTTVTTPATLVSTGSGNYKITVPENSGATDPAKLVTYVVNNATYLFRVKAADGTQPIVVAKNGTPPLRDLVSNDGCKTCHGNFVFNSSHYSAPAEYCQVCHVRDGRSFYNAFKDADGNWDTTTNAGDGGNLTIYVHGVHNSHHMPAGSAYFHGEEWSVGYPSDMRNCVSCHKTDAQLAAAVNAPVNGYLCFSCHQDWDGFVDHDGNKLIAADSFHRGFTISTDCMSCHASMADKNEAGDFHTAMEATDSHYNSFYRGKDVSFENPNTVSFVVTGVTKSSTDVTFTWTASKGGVAVDPCNTDINNGPTFQGLGAYLAYAKGDDWVNEGVGSSPGQPAGAKNLFTSLATTCSANVATTTGLKASTAATYATKAMVAIGGKPLDNHVASGSAFFVRVPSPTYAFNMTDGSSATARRNIVDNSKCTGCHQGTMYQHGGDRIDNTQLCVMCHNPASNDKNNRADKFQIVNEDGTVDTNSTYDGKAAQTYDLRYLLHSIHGVGFSETPYVIYRSRGIYAFVTDDMAKPTGWPEDGGKAIYGSDNSSEISHNWTVVHYPKLVNDCEACHNPGTYEVTDQTKAVALTVDAGTSWSSQADDTVIGPTAAACISCHNNAPTRTHAEANGYKAVVTKDAMLKASE